MAMRLKSGMSERAISYTSIPIAMHINPDHFLETPEGRILTPERNARAWEQCYDALRDALDKASPTSRLYVMVGAQASGKSTWARRTMNEEPGAIIFDAISGPKRSERAPIPHCGSPPQRLRQSRCGFRHLSTCAWSATPQAFAKRVGP